MAYDFPPGLIVPGLHGSTHGHWQRWWQGVVPSTKWVDQDDWERADLGAWTDRVLQEAGRQRQPVWLVAHSFGCLAAVHAIRQRPQNIAGAFLVAPADPDRFGLGEFLSSGPLQRPTALVVSSNDPWLLESKAVWLGQRWGSEIFPIGAAGHVNTEAGFGPWVQGLLVFRDFVQRMSGNDAANSANPAPFAHLSSATPSEPSGAHPRYTTNTMLSSRI